MERDKIAVRREDGCCELLIWNVPKSLKEKFKIKCVEKSVTMREALINLMRTFVK